jgi:hypothetical protein
MVAPVRSVAKHRTTPHEPEAGREPRRGFPSSFGSGSWTPSTLANHLRRRLMIWA